MTKIRLIIIILVCVSTLTAQDEPVISSWLQNTTETGSYYMSGNSTPIENNLLYNCQLVEYSDSFVYVHSNGIPSFTTGPHGNTNNIAEDQNSIFKMPIYPQENLGDEIFTGLGNIGVFINGTALFNYLDGIAWNPNTEELCGGPGPSCPGGANNPNLLWKRDAVLAEMNGFDCSKGHPANGNYHHHQNPSAFNLDLDVVSNICNLYDAEGLYAIDSTVHSPLIGFAYDGFPIYGAYAYANSDGTGGIVRMKSSYQLQNITDRPDGPPVDTLVLEPGPGGGQFNELFLGYFGADYEFISHPGQEDYLDEHNGRICITPEYPEGTYAYFATVDEQWNSAYPYAVGPSYYGVYENRKVETVEETTTVYSDPNSISESEFNALQMTVFPNPASDLIAIQVHGLLRSNMNAEILDMTGRIIQQQTIRAGSTITYFDTRTVYTGHYIIRLSSRENARSFPISISR